MSNSTYYHRSMELIAVISEEFGEAVKEINNHNFKKQPTLENALIELKQIDSPLKELYDITIKEITYQNMVAMQRRRESGEKE